MIGKWSAAVGRTVRIQSAPGAGAGGPEGECGPPVDGEPAPVANEHAPVTYGLILACCLIFLIGPAAGLNPGYGSGDELIAAQRTYFRRWGVVPVELFTGSSRALLTPLTALFVHGSWLHLLGNMLFLFVFGAMVEERMGHLRFALFYVGCGYLALVAYAVAHAGSPQSLVGASGAISAVLGAFLFLFPRARVTSLFPFLFFLPLRFPAWVTLPFWVSLQWLAAGRQTSGPGVAYLAHLVGFGLGFVCAWGRRGWRARVKGPVPGSEERDSRDHRDRAHQDQRGPDS